MNYFRFYILRFIFIAIFYFDQWFSSRIKLNNYFINKMLML